MGEFDDEQQGCACCSFVCRTVDLSPGDTNDLPKYANDIYQEVLASLNCA